MSHDATLYFILAVVAATTATMGAFVLFRIAASKRANGTKGVVIQTEGLDTPGYNIRRDDWTLPVSYLVRTEAGEEIRITSIVSHEPGDRVLLLKEGQNLRFFTEQLWIPRLLLVIAATAIVCACVFVIGPFK